MFRGLIAFVLFFLAIFTWQHAARKRDWKWKPTYIIDSATEQLVRFFSWVGRTAVWISSFYTYIDLKDWLVTLEELWHSIQDFTLSWTAFIRTYVADMNLYDHPYLISMGSATLVGLLAFGIYYFRNFWLFRIIGTFVVKVGTKLFGYFQALRQEQPESTD